jgi:hypothetical protein
MPTLQQQMIGRHLWVKQSPEWSAVLDTLALPLIRDEERERLLAYVDLDRRHIEWDQIHQEARNFPREVQILLRIAHALFNGGDCQLSELHQLSSAGRSAAILLIAQRYR